MVGAAAGLIGAVLIAAGYLLIGGLPSPDASGQDVYARFLDDRSTLRLGALLTIAGIASFVAFLAAFREAVDAGRRTVASAAMLSAGLVAAAAASFYAAAIGALAVGAENAAPESSRATLDLAQAVWAGGGAFFALTLVAAAGASARPGSGVTARVGGLAVAAAPLCLLWTAPLVVDAGVLEQGSIVGTEIGLLALLLWIVFAALWMRRRAALAGAELSTSR